MNGLSDIDTSEATEHLKNILNVGKPESADTENTRSNTMSTSDVAGGFANENAFQKIELSGNEENFPIYGTNVSILSSPLTRGTECGKIQIDNIVDYGWEQKYHFGSLVSLHLSKKYFAYALRAQSSAFGFVRVMKHNTNAHTLLRNFHGDVKDLSFAHTTSRILLGCVDEIGELFVYEILDSDKGLTTELCIHITRPLGTVSSAYHRLVWCPYVPEDGTGLDSGDVQDDLAMFMSSLLVVTHDEIAEIWNVDLLIKEYGRGKLAFDDVKVGLQLISEHIEPITAAAFSPDAIALATASLDGEVKFFQVNIQENEATPKCLHKWTPHHGKPLSSLFFLDNHRNHTPEVQFWKYAVTGANNNQEIKVWTCKTWSCLQTIRIFPCNEDNVTPCLKAELDLSAGYLLLSDINRKVIYIFRIHQENNAIISSVAEYFVKYPVLSFAIADVVPCKGKLPFNLKNSGDEDDEDEDDDDEKDEDYDDSDSTGRRLATYILRVYWIHSKSFQLCRIVYDPKTESPLQSVASISSSQDSFVYKDVLLDLGNDGQDQTVASDQDLCILEQVEHDESPSTIVPNAATISSVSTPSVHRSPGYPSECTDFLLTPKDFTSPHATLPSVNISNPFNLLSMDVSKELNISNKILQDDELSSLETEHAQRPRRKSSQHSCASSPSREVAEILSPGQILSHDDMNVSPEKKDIEDASSVTDTPHKDVLCHTPSSLSRRQADYVQSEWPQAPDPNKAYKIIPRNDSDHQLTHQPITQDGILSHDEDDNVISRPLKSPLEGFEQVLESISHKMTTIADAVQIQNQAIQCIRSDIDGLQQQQKYIQSKIQAVDTLDTAVASKLEHLFSAPDFSRLENLLAKRDLEDVQHYEQQITSLSQNLIANMNNRVDKVVKQEVKATILPSISKSLDSAILRLQGELLQNLNSTEAALKESINKHIKSKAFSDSLATTAVSLLQQSIQVSCKDVFQNSVIPSMDKCCQMLFGQINEVFSRGSVDYVKKNENHLQMVSSSLNSTVQKCDDRINNFLVEAENVLTKIAVKSNENCQDAASAHEKLLIDVKKVVQEEVNKSLVKHSASTIAAIRSTQNTPAPRSEAAPIDPQHILHLARNGRINEAFQQALSAVDVKVVMSLCESVPVEQVFEPVPCPLEQHVLLSLIHQLSGDFSDRTSLRLKYVEDAIASLDDSSPVTKGHIGMVLGNLKQKLTYFMECNPTIRVGRNCRRILLTVDSFLK